MSILNPISEENADSKVILIPNKFCIKNYI